MKAVIQHPLLGSVTLSQSRRSRRITISVRPDGKVRLSFPKIVSTKRAVQFLDDKATWVESTIVRMRAKYPNAANSEIVDTTYNIEELRRQAKIDLPPRIDEIARRLGIKYGKVSVRASRSRWGSCSAHNDISLSIFLMKLPEHLRNYVIVHELCHTIHKNHSPQFHALVDSCLKGREKELNKELKNHSAYR